MSFPELTPASKTSAIVLPEEGVTAEVADSLAIGYYKTSESFLSGAAAQVK